MKKSERDERDDRIRDELATALVERDSAEVDHRDAMEDLFAALVERLDRKSRKREAAKVRGKTSSD